MILRYPIKGDGPIKGDIYPDFGDILPEETQMIPEGGLGLSKERGGISSKDTI